MIIPPKCPVFSEKCPFCNAEITKLPSFVKTNSWEISQWSFVVYACGTAHRPQNKLTKNDAGRKCSAYKSAYPLPAHLAAIHCSE